jgi:hypothetical protein
MAIFSKEIQILSIFKEADYGSILNWFKTLKLDKSLLLKISGATLLGLSALYVA